jgi:FkbM family methyltransferase
MSEIDRKLDEVIRRVTRLNRDVEQIKLFSGITLGANRAVTLLANGQRIYIDPRDRGCGMNFMTEGKYEEEEVRIFRSFLKPGITILDIGANYGYYSIIASPYIRPGGKIHAFEPNPHVHGLFESSVYLNGFTDIVTAHRLGVFDSESNLDFQIDPTGPGGARIVDPDSPCPPGLEMIKVPVRPIDQILPENSVVDLVKIDVEGREWNVLRGMRETVRRSENIKILMELFYSFFQNEALFRSFISFITDDMGLMIYRPAANGRLKQVTADDLIGKESYVVLSAKAIDDVPDLTVFPIQLNRSPESRMMGDRLDWVGVREGLNIIAHGPYVYLPKGSYRVVVKGSYSGNIRFALQENFGDLIYATELPAGSDHSLEIGLIFDAPKMEVAFWGPAGAQMSLEQVEFWKI